MEKTIYVPCINAVTDVTQFQKSWTSEFSTVIGIQSSTTWVNERSESESANLRQGISIHSSSF